MILYLVLIYYYFMSFHLINYINIYIYIYIYIYIVKYYYDFVNIKDLYTKSAINC